jgi:HAD superfamily phosphoserine phosphatase-like hydrolase
MDRYGLSPDRRLELVPDFVRALPPADGRPLAVFDADGTLWTDDVADDFTTWMIDEGHVSGERWPEYMRIYRDDPPTGCEFLLGFYTGMTPATLAKHVQTWWDHHAHRRWIPEVVESLHWVATRGYAVWIVSGTPTDFLLPLLQMLPVADVIAMDFALDSQGRISGEVAGISCAGEGKAEKLRSLLHGRDVALCVGNGSLDGPMMELATQAWAVYPNPDFAAHSRAQGWPILPRPADFVEEEKFLLDD